MAKFANSWAIGNQISATTVEEALRTAQIDFTVDKSDLQAVTPGTKVPDMVATFREDTGDVLGVVGREYGLVQNQEAFDFADLIQDLKWIRGGMTSAGLVYLVAELPERWINGERFVPHLVFQNSFNGGWLLKGQTILEKDGREYYIGKGDIKIRHSQNAQAKVRLAAEALQTINSYIEDFRYEAEDLATKELSAAALDVVVSDLFPIKEGASERVKANQLEKRRSFTESYNSAENKAWWGTGWGIMNAFADFAAKARTKAAAKGGRKAESAFENALISGENYERLIKILDRM